MTDLEQLRYPVGRFERLKAPLDRAAREVHIETIAGAPATFLSLTTGAATRSSTRRTGPADGRCGRSCTTCPTAT